jgi:uncharacterized membrane protein YvbJ
MIVCTACGTSNPDTAAYCSKCARKLDKETQDAVARQRAEHTATGINWSTVAMAIITIVVIAAVVVLVVTHVL